MSYELHHGDCLEVMKSLPDNSVDAVITDPPYGMTACKWDSVIPFEPMWKELKRIAKPKAAICLFGSQPFTSALVMSNPHMFRYEWIWEKERPSNPLIANIRVMPRHENVLVFYAYQPVYQPQKETRIHKRNNGQRRHLTATKGLTVMRNGDGATETIHPSSVVRFSSGRLGQHPTQKPVDLLRYLVRTYTRENETVLDFTMGSGTTGVACELENRNFIGIEKDAGYFEIAKKRIEDVTKKEPLFMVAAYPT